MIDTWGNLDEHARDVLQRRAAGEFSDQELDRRTRRDEQGQVHFRLFGGTDMPGAVEAFEGEDYAMGPPPPVEVTLIDPEEFDYEVEISGEDAAWAKPIDDKLAPLQQYFAQDPGVGDEERSAAPDGTLPAVVDHRPLQSPVKNQGTVRATCVSHASLALLEAASHIPDDLSEQYTHYKFTEFMGRPHDQNNGLRTTDAGPYLARPDGRVCLEENWRYVPLQSTINEAVAAGQYGPPAAAVGNQTFGYRSYKLVDDAGLEGESIKNARFLESLIALGFDLVLGVYASWDDSQNRDVLRPFLDSNGQPLPAGHAMLLVGYDRPSQYFIVKNSWGPGWGHAGYGHFHYDFFRVCAKYGFTVSDMEPPGRAAA